MGLEGDVAVPWADEGVRAERPRAESGSRGSGVPPGCMEPEDLLGAWCEGQRAPGRPVVGAST